MQVLYWSLLLLGELRVYRKYSEKYWFGQEYSILTHLTNFIEMSGPGGAEGQLGFKVLLSKLQDLSLSAG